MDTYECGSGYTHKAKEICRCEIRKRQERRIQNRYRELTDREREENTVRIARTRQWLEQRGIIHRRKVSQ